MIYFSNYRVLIKIINIPLNETRAAKNQGMVAERLIPPNLNQKKSQCSPKNATRFSSPQLYKLMCHLLVFHLPCYSVGASFYPAILNL